MKIVDFVVDTGSIFSGITEKDAIMMGIDCTSLPDHNREAIGFGGTFRNKMINRRVVLTFQSNQGERIIPCGSFIVTCIPLEVTGQEREKMLRYTPNVLGMDILSKFKVHIEKTRVELET